MSKKYTGRCHCGAVEYNVTADIDQLIECNCSLCKVTGWRLTFVGADQFDLTKGEDAVVDYQFGEKNLHHPFCATCGVRAYSWGYDPAGNKTYAVNSRCLEGFELGDTTITQYDGASI